MQKDHYKTNFFKKASWRKERTCIWKMERASLSQERGLPVGANLSSYMVMSCMWMNSCPMPTFVQSPASLRHTMGQLGNRTEVFPFPVQLHFYSALQYQESWLKYGLPGADLPTISCLSLPKQHRSSYTVYTNFVVNYKKTTNMSNFDICFILKMLHIVNCPQ